MGEDFHRFRVLLYLHKFRHDPLNWQIGQMVVVFK